MGALQISNGPIPFALSSYADHPTQNHSPIPGFQEQMTHLDADEAKAHSLYELNKTQSLTKHLPSEILANIFLHSLQLGPPRTRLQFVIGAVCSHWRTILWNTPGLWVKYSQEVWSDSQRDTHTLLQTYFDNSGELPISIHIGFRYRVESSVGEGRERKGWYEEVDLLKPTKAILFSPRNAKRIHALRLYQLPPSWLPLVRQHCAKLHALEIIWRGVYAFGPIGQVMTIIRDRLGALGQGDQTPWTSIAILNIEEVPVDICYALLAGCPNLIDFSAECCLPLQHGHFSTKTSVMGQLRHLKLRVLYPSQYSPLEFFQFPVLQNFRGSVQRPPETPFDTFLWTIPLTITTLELGIRVARSDGKVPDWLSVLFSRMPQLTQLTLNIFPATPLWSIFPVLHKSALLPSLRVLRCRYNTCAREGMTTLGFLQLMAQKKQAGIQGFSFDSVNAPVDWPEDIREGVRGLVRQGFDIRICEDGAIVPWLLGI